MTLPADEETVEVYNDLASDYLNFVATEDASPEILRFIGLLPKAASVLDLGCGPGNSAAAMKQAGFDVDAMDASREMVEIARTKFAVDAELAKFSQLDAQQKYDGIFANFSLLHAPKSEFPDHLDRIHTALKPGGVLHLGLKLGNGEKTDKLGRFYAYYQVQELRDLLIAAGFTVKSELQDSAPGLAGNVEPYIMVTAHA